LFLMALDGGKTKTSCVLFNERGNILALSSSGPSGLILPLDTIKKNILKAITDCLLKVGIKIEDVDVIVLGLADLDTERDRERAQEVVKSLSLPPSIRIIVEHDAVVAYYAVTYGKPGIAVIAGTGSIAFGMNEYGERARSSGWGWLFGDEGSAFWIAREALMLAAKAYDGRGSKTKLTDALIREFKIKDFLSIIDVVYKDLKGDPGNIAKIAELVDKVAIEGDKIAYGIMKRAGIELALSAYAVAEKLGMVNKRIVVGGVGSVFNSSIVKETFYDWLRSRLRNAIFKPPLIGYQPIIGSVVLALRALGLNYREVAERIERIKCQLS